MKSFRKRHGYYGYTVLGITRAGRVVLQSWGRPIPGPYDAPPSQPPSTLRTFMTLD